MTPHWTDRCIELRAWLTGHPRVLIGTDFDGTLAPLVGHADDARLPEAHRSALIRLMELPGVYVSVISGRSLADVSKRVNVPGILYAGNHGLEMMSADGTVETAPGAEHSRTELEALLARLAPLVAEIPGVWIEDKHLTASVHYRLSPESEHLGIERLVTNAVHGAPGLCLRAGRFIWEIRPDIHWHKGSALIWHMHHSGVHAGAAVFMGDDLTDYDAFEVLSGGWSFFVGVDAPSIASARLDTVDDTARLLEWMIRVRREAPYLADACGQGQP